MLFNSMDYVYLVVRKDNFYPLAVFSSVEKAKEELPGLVYNKVIGGTDFLVQQFPVDPSYKPEKPLDSKLSFKEVQTSVTRNSES